MSLVPGRHRNKVRQSTLDAVATINDGARIAVGGFGLCGNPEALIDAVIDRKLRGITVVSNNCGNLGKGLAKWLREGVVSKVMCSYIGNNEDLHRLMAAKQLEVQIIPQGTLIERMRAAGAGIPAFFTPTGAGTVIAEGKEERTFNGRPHILEESLHVDFALIRARQADHFGNARFWRTARNFSPIMATAAKTTILEADELVETGALGPDDIHLPGLFVHHVVEVRQHENPFEYRMVRPRA